MSTFASDEHLRGNAHLNAPEIGQKPTKVLKDAEGAHDFMYEHVEELRAPSIENGDFEDF